MVRYFHLGLVLVMMGCAARAPEPRAPETPDHLPPPMATAEEATDREAERTRAVAESARAEADAVATSRKLAADTDRETAVRRHREVMTVRRTGPSPAGRWNPAKGERPSDRVVPPASGCRTMVATETRPRAFAVRQADGSYTVHAEPVAGYVQPIVVCPPSTAETIRLQTPR